MIAVKRAGYRSGDMLTSKNNFLYCYLFFLMGRHEYGVGQSELREAIARWFFMASLTGRYTGSPETILEADLRRFSEAETADDFVAILDGVIDTQLTVRLLERDASGPTRLVRGLEPLPVRLLRQPQPARGQGAVLEHEDQRALRPRRQADQEPGRATPPLPQGLPLVHRYHRHDSRPTRSATSRSSSGPTTSRSPTRSQPSTSRSTSTSFLRTDQEQARFWHALPPEWEHMDYFEFLRDRRKRMAKVVEKGFERLRSGGSARERSRPVRRCRRSSDLLRQMETNRVEFKQIGPRRRRQRRPGEGDQRRRRQDRRRIPELVRRDARHRDHRRRRHHRNPARPRLQASGPRRLPELAHDASS